MMEIRIAEDLVIQPVKYYGVVGDNGCGVFSNIGKMEVASRFIINMKKEVFESYESARVWAENQIKHKQINIYKNNWFYHLSKYGIVEKEKRNGKK